MSQSHVQASAAGRNGVTVHVAMELSKARWQVGVHDPAKDKISRYAVSGGDAAALLAIMEQARERVAAATGQPVQVVSCYEAGYDGAWLHRLLESRGVANRMIDPASVQVNRRARRVKTDRIDLDQLLRVLMALSRGEPRVCSVVRVPDRATEDARRPDRERERLTNEVTQHVNRIKGLLFAQGIREFDPRRAGWSSRVDELRTGDGHPLLPRLKQELMREGKRLELVLHQLREVEAERDAAQPTSAAEAAMIKTSAQLQTLKSIGPAIASRFSREIFCRAFDNRRQVGGYAGMTPSPYNSGASERDQGISKSGNPRVRDMAIEAAWLWLRHQPDSELSQWFRRRVGSLKGRIRRINIVALARKLLIALWRFLKTGQVPKGAVLKPMAAA